MGFVYYPSDAPDTSQFVYSGWIWVPSDSIAAAKAESASPLSVPLAGVIPVMTMGPRVFMKNLISEDVVTGSNPSLSQWTCISDAWVRTNFSPQTPATTPSYSFQGQGAEISPSYIGIDCNGDFPSLAVNISMPFADSGLSIAGSLPNSSISSVPGNINWYFLGGCGATYYDHSSPPNPPPNDPICMSSIESYTIKTNAVDDGNSLRLTYRPEIFRTHPSMFVEDSSSALLPDQDKKKFGSALRIEPEKWYHIIVCFVANPVSTSGLLINGRLPQDYGITNYRTIGQRVTSSSKLFLSLNDVNITRDNLTAYWAQKNPNDILSITGHYVAADVKNVITDQSTDCIGNDITQILVETLPKYNYVPSNMRMSPIGFPVSSEFSTRAKHVILAESQMFTGCNLDTGVLSNRHIFVRNSGKPAPMSVARKFFGKKPDVALHGTTNWKNAKNTGSGTEFGVAVGDIKKFLPNPQIGK